MVKRRLLSKIVYIYEDVKQTTKPISKSKKHVINDSDSEESDDQFEFNKTETVISDSDQEHSDVEMTDVESDGLTLPSNSQASCY